MTNLKFFLSILVFFLLSNGFAQKMDTIIDGYDTIFRFYYEENIISSEGPIKNGLPNGYWKNYYPDGQIKSEGNRVNGKKQGPFRFYDSKGNLTLEINYSNDLKDGVRTTILAKEYILEEFENDEKNGLTQYFDRKDSTIKRVVPYKNNLPHGIARKYSKSGIINEIIDYKNGKITSIQYVNRLDNKDKKQGKWVQFWPNGLLKSEGYFLNDQKHGFFKFYAQDGNLVKVEKFQNGYPLERAPEVVELDEKIAYYPNGKIKTIGHFLDSTPQGIWQEFSEDGEVKETYIFEMGRVTAKGIIDKEGNKQGDWKEYYPDQRLLGKGQFKNGHRVGKWIFYHENGNVEQTGYYNDKGELDGEWVWFYESGKLLRKEKFSNGELNGTVIELYEDGDTIIVGEYFENKMTGYWILQYGDYKEEGEYIDGNREGMWYSYYKNGSVYFKGKYIDGSPDGQHTWHWPNGKIMQQGSYLGYQKEGNWIKYDEKGFPILSIYYTSGKETKYDGIAVEFAD